MHYLCVQLTYSETATRLYFNVGVNNFCLHLSAIKENLPVRQQERNVCALKAEAQQVRRLEWGQKAAPPGGCAAPA